MVASGKSAKECSVPPTVRILMTIGTGLATIGVPLSLGLAVLPIGSRWMYVDSGLRLVSVVCLSISISMFSDSVPDSKAYVWSWGWAYGLVVWGLVLQLWSAAFSTISVLGQYEQLSTEMSPRR
jgi:hypothetical protein